MLQEYPEAIPYLRVSTEFYVHTVKQDQNISLTAVSLYDPNDAFGSLNYQNKVQFRLLRIRGEYAEEVVNCTKTTYTISDRYASKINYYCYDPLKAEFVCATQATSTRLLSSYEPSAPSRALQSYLDDRDKDPTRQCSDIQDKYVCNTYDK